MSRPDYARAAGIALVALAAAAISCWTLFRLGMRIGLPPPLAALLPVAIDAQAALAAREWLSPDAPRRTRAYACGLVITAVLVSVAGNATEHLLATLALTTPLAVIVAVSAIPPIALAATLHLGALTARRADTVERAQNEPGTPDAREPEPAQRTETSAPSALEEPAERATTKRAPRRDLQQHARRVFERARAEGRADELTGAALAAEVGAHPSTARRWLADWRDTTTEDEAPRLAVVGQNQAGQR